MTGGHAWQGMCMAGGHAWRGVHGRGASVAGETATTAGGTHPTGMHFCLSGGVPIWNVEPSYISRTQYGISG